MEISKAELEIKFGCTGCGLCCKHVKNALDKAENSPEPYRTELLNFPFAAKKDGSCEKLIDNKCSVYNDRPTICNIDSMYEKYKGVYFNEDKKIHYLREATACNQLMKIAGYPKEKFIDLSKYRA